MERDKLPPAGRWLADREAAEQAGTPIPSASIDGIMRLTIKAIIALTLVVGTPILVWIAVNMVLHFFTGR